MNTVSIMHHHSHWLVWLAKRFEFTDLPQLQSVKLGYKSFQYSSFKLSNLTSLKSIDIGEWCFHYAPSLSLIGLFDGLVWTHRSSSTTISPFWWSSIHEYRIIWNVKSHFYSVHCYWWKLFQFGSIIFIDWFDILTEMNSQIFLIFDQSYLIEDHSIVFSRLCLRVIERMDWWFRFA